MNTKFINILGNRINISSIKRYKPMEDLKLVVYFSVSRQKVDNEIFTFPTELNRDEMLDQLDIYFDCYEEDILKKIKIDSDKIMEKLRTQR